MFPRPRACSRAVQRRIQAPTSSIWISDDTLARTFEHFCIVSSQSKRHGSSTPGPMESRRRLGKRKMTQLSEAAYTPHQGIGALWGLPGDPDMSKWQWQAPSSQPRVAEKDERPLLPKWLQDLTTDPELDEGPVDTNTYQRTRTDSHARDIFKTFRISMSTAKGGEVSELCARFNQNIERSLSLGLIPESILSDGVTRASEYISKATLDESLLYSRLLSLYQSVWQGIKACKVLGSSEFEGIGLPRLLVQLSKLTLNVDGWNLVVDIIESASLPRRKAWQRPLRDLKKIWVSNIANASYGDSLGATESLNNMPLQKFMDLTISLSKATASCSPDFPRDIVRQSTDHIICRMFEDPRIKHPRTMGNIWLSMLAKSSWMKDDLLAETWSKLDGPMQNRGDRFLPPMRLSVRSQILKHCLDRTSREQSDPLQVWQSTFGLLRQLDKHGAEYVMLRSFAEAGLPLRIEDARQAINILNLHDPQRGLSLLRHYVQTGVNPRLSYVDAIAVSLVSQTDLQLNDIWRALDIPVHRATKLYPLDAPPDRFKIYLIDKMALAFTQAKNRSSRVMMRNVANCVIYLLRHKVPISAQMAMSLSYMGIQRDVIDKGILVKEKVRRILDIVKLAEGPEVAEHLTEAVIVVHRELQKTKKRES